jgi:hypothetical protein
MRKMMLSARRSAGPLLAASLLALDAGGARAQGQIVRLPEQDRRLAGTAAEVFSIGKAEGAAHEMFGEIGSVAFDAAENLYVLDRQAKRVMVYDRAGRFLRQIGKEGEGPGELIAPRQMTLGGDGTVIVFDLARPGYSLFRPDGTFLRNVTAEGALPEPNVNILWHPRGGVVGTFREPPPDRVQPGIATLRDNVQPLMFQPLGGGAPARLFSIPRTTITQQSATPDGNFQVRVSPPPVFTPPVLVGALPNGQIALSFTSGYTVRVLDQNGQTLRYLQRPMRARLTTERDRERARQELRERWASGRGMVRISRGGPGGGGAPPRPPRSMPPVEERLAQMEFADTIPALQGLLVAPSGKLLVERTAADVGGPGPVDVITPEGQYVGTFNGVGLPDAVSRGGLAAWVEYDEDQVGRVIVRRLPVGWR